MKDIDNETGKVKYVDGSRGILLDDAGDPVAMPGNSPKRTKVQKVPKTTKI